MNKEFRIGYLFRGYNGNTDIKKEHINGKGYPVVSSGLENTGIIGFSDIEARIFPSNTITIDMFGNVFFRDFEYKIVTHARVFSLVLKDHQLTLKAGLYIASILSWLSKVFSYNNMCSYNKIAHMNISLPVIEYSDPNHEYTVDDIDWQYMEDRIKELEKDRIKELDAYLKAANLDDYELTDEDKKILSLSRKSTSIENSSLETDCENGRVRFKKFVVSSMFKRVFAKCKKDNFNKREDTSTVPNQEFCVPLVNAKLGDNGIMFYGRKSEWNTQEMCIDVIQNGAVATGKVYAQPHSVAVLWDAYLIKPIKDVSSEEILLYLTKCIEKITREQFSYDKKATWERVKACEVTLPVTPDNEPDFDYMERYIRAIEKLTIADVVKYKNKVINTTKKLVNS